jgi:hypothetical protein
MLRGVEGHFYLSRQRDCNGIHHHHPSLLLRWRFTHVEVWWFATRVAIGGRGKTTTPLKQQQLIIIDWSINGRQLPYHLAGIPRVKMRSANSNSDYLIDQWAPPSLVGAPLVFPHVRSFWVSKPAKICAWLKIPLLG